MKLFSILLIVGIAVAAAGIYEQVTFPRTPNMQVAEWNKLLFDEMVAVVGLTLTLAIVPWVFSDIKKFRFKDVVEVICMVSLAVLITIESFAVSYLWFMVPSFGWIYVLGKIHEKKWHHLRGFRTTWY